MEKRNWLRDSGMEKQYMLHRRLGCSIPLLVGLVVSIIPAVLNAWLWIPVVFIVIFPISNYFAKRVFVNSIFCPDCGFNPTRRKSDGEPRKDYHKVLNQLERFEECPNCGVSQGTSDADAKSPKKK